MNLQWVARKIQIQQPVIQNIIITFLSQVLLLFISIGTTAIVARWLGPEGKGIFALAMLVPGVLNIILNGGIGIANVYFAGSRRIDIPRLITNSIAFSFIATGIGTCLIGGLVFTGWFQKMVPGLPLWIAIIALLWFPVALMASYLGNILQGLQRFLTYNIMGLVQGILTLTLIIIFVVTFNKGLLGAVLSYIGTAIIGLVILFLLLKKEGNFCLWKWDRMVMRSTLSYGLKGHIGNILQFFNYRLDMFILNYFLGTAGVGIYSISVGISELLWHFPNAVGFVLFPKAASTKPEIMNEVTPRILRITLLLTTIGAMGLYFLGEQLIEVIYSKAFLPAYVPMLVLLPGVILLGGAKVLTNDIAGRGHPEYNSVNAALGLIITVVLDLLLIPKYGVFGAALASSITYALIFFIAVGIYLSVSRKASGRFPTKSSNVISLLSPPTY